MQRIKQFICEFAVIKIRHNKTDAEHKHYYLEIYVFGFPVFKKIGTESSYFFKKYNR